MAGLAEPDSSSGAAAQSRRRAAAQFSRHRRSVFRLLPGFLDTTQASRTRISPYLALAQSLP